MSDERPESLAAQAASWVPPWERAPRPPDRNFEAEIRAGESDDEELAESNLTDDDDFDPAFEGADPSAGDGVPADGVPAGRVPAGGVPVEGVPAEVTADGALADGAPVDGVSADGALADGAPVDGVSADGALADGAPAGGVPAELPPFPEEAGGPPTVDAPREMPGDEEREPTDVGGGPELPLPGAIEEAAENEIGNAPMVDAPLDGDDAGDVFDVAADDDVADGAEIDLPFAEEVPGPEEDDEPPAGDTPAGQGEDSASTTGAAQAAAAAKAAAEGESVAAAQAAAEGESVAAAQATDDGGPVAAAQAAPDGGSAVAARAAAEGESVAAARAGAEGESVAAAQTAADGGSAVAARTAAQDGPGAADAAARGADDGAVAVTAGAVASRPAARARSGSGIPAQGRGSKGGAAASGASSTRTEEEAEPLPPMEDAELRAALEAILLVVDEPVAEMQLAQIVEQPTERVAGMLEDISARYTAAGHGFDLRRAAGGWRLYTRPEYAAYVERFVLDGQSVRLTQAALETLAVVAYKQPVTRSRISAIRGVNCDGVMRTLSTRGLIEECGTEGETGAFLYRTTALFLEKLGLNSVDQLPPLAPFLPDDVEEVLDASG